MAITIDWATFIINVPKADLTLVQSTPIEIYNMDLNWFRLQLKDLEDDEEGIVFNKTHNHNTEVSLGGLTFARVIEILDPYSVTFEDGQYAVNLVGANSNVGDKVNVNQVSVRSQNSAGLISSPDIEFASFEGRVSLCEIHGVPGTIFPTGTQRQPVDNWADALIIADFRGFFEIDFFHDVTLTDAVDLSNFKIVGQNAIRSSLTLSAAPNLTNCEITETRLSGELDGNTLVRNCLIGNLTYFNGILYICAIGTDPIVLAGGSAVTAMLLDCYSAVPGGNDRPTIDFDNTETNLAIRGWKGGLELINKSQAVGEVSIDIDSGVVYVRSSCTAGQITIRGTGLVVDESGPGCDVVTTALLNPEHVATEVWAYERI